MLTEKTDQEAITRVLKARGELVMARRFYGVLVSHVEPVLSRKFPTMATNGKQHFFNPEFVHELTQDELLAVQAHESEHDARHHGTRRNGRDPHKWNVACDFAINIDLVEEGFKLPADALIDPQYKGMSAEDIYRARELDEQNEQPQEQPKKKPQESGNGKPSDDKGQGDGDDGKAEGKGDDAGAKGDAGDDKADGGDSGAGDGDGDDKADAGDGAGDGEDGEPGQGGSSGDPGRCGEVLDSAADDGIAASDQDVEWERIVRQAAAMAAGVGQLPGHISREIERANNPPRNWRDELREFCEQGALRIETWNRPNRRFMGRGIVLPSTQKDGVSKAAFLIDTSGSMDAVALSRVRAEAQAMLDDGIIDEIVVVYGDTQVTRVDQYATGDEIEFDPRGGGGTDMAPLFKYVAQEHDDATLIVNFTDLEFYGPPGPEPSCPVLFAVYGYPQTVARRMAKTPWGARAIDVGVH